MLQAVNANTEKITEKRTQKTTEKSVERFKKTCENVSTVYYIQNPTVKVETFKEEVQRWQYILEPPSVDSHQAKAHR